MTSASKHVTRMATRRNIIFGLGAIGAVGVGMPLALAPRTIEERRAYNESLAHAIKMAQREKPYRELEAEQKTMENRIRKIKMAKNEYIYSTRQAFYKSHAAWLDKINRSSNLIPIIIMVGTVAGGLSIFLSHRWPKK